MPICNNTRFKQRRTFSSQPSFIFLLQQWDTNQRDIVWSVSDTNSLTTQLYRSWWLQMIFYKPSTAVSPDMLQVNNYCLNCSIRSLFFADLSDSQSMLLLQSLMCCTFRDSVPHLLLVTTDHLSYLCLKYFYLFSIHTTSTRWICSHFQAILWNKRCLVVNPSGLVVWGVFRASHLAPTSGGLLLSLACNAA